MINLLLTFIFKVINWLASLLLSPILLLISLVLPQFGTYLSYYNRLLGSGLNYINFFIDLFMIPRPPLIAVVGLGVGIITFNATLRVVGLILAVFKYFKP